MDDDKGSLEDWSPKLPPPEVNEAVEDWEPKEYETMIHKNFQADSEWGPSKSEMQEREHDET